MELVFGDLMYYVMEVETSVRVPPHLFQADLKKAIADAITEEYAGKIEEDGVIVGVISIDEIGEGKILPEDGAIYYLTKFKLLKWIPMMHEVVEGVVKEITDFGVFVNIGPMDGLVHISQVMDDYVSVSKSGSLQGRQTKKTLKVGDQVRARIIAISLKSQTAKIGLTMRQPGLGKIEWIKKKGGKK